VVLHQLLLEVLVAAKVREEQLVLRVQRRDLAKDAKVELVGRLDSDVRGICCASGHRDKDIPGVGVIVSSSLMIGNFSVPCSTWIVEMPILSTPSRDSSNNHVIDDFDD
jgi:hypothetical protein